MDINYGIQLRVIKQINNIKVSNIGEMEAELTASQPLKFTVGYYKVKVVISGKKISVMAQSEISTKLFEGIIEKHHLSERDKMMFEDIEAVYATMSSAWLKAERWN